MVFQSKKDKTRIEDLERENRRLRRSVEELSVLNELAREIGAASDLDKIMRTIIRRSVQAVQAQQGIISLVDEEERNPLETLVRTMGGSSPQRPYHIDQMLVGWMLQHRKPLRVNSPHEDDRFRGEPWDEGIESILCAPLMSRSRLIGILTAYNKKGGRPFTEGDQRLLTIIAGQSAQVIEHARLYEEEKELLVMQEELRLAREIQTRLLPADAPDLDGYEMASTSIPAREVGGDYFDYITIDEASVALCLGDVSGKGLPASLLVASVQATLRSQTPWTASASECIERANRLICQSVHSNTFVTLFYGRLDTNRHSLAYVNAGHNPPLFYPDSGCEPRTLTAGGLVLGIMADTVYSVQTIAFEPGSLLVVYSDGVTEAMNSDDEPFGEERLQECIQLHMRSSADELIEHIVDAVRTYREGARQTDDITVLVVRRHT